MLDTHQIQPMKKLVVARRDIPKASVWYMILIRSPLSIFCDGSGRYVVRDYTAVLVLRFYGVTQRSPRFSLLKAHDPTSGMGQGNDRGTQYRSGFYYYNDEQKALIEASKDAYEKKLEEATGLKRKITTEIAPASDYEKYGGLWFFAEPYHQQYLAKPGARPYCSAQPQGVPLPDYEEWCPFDDEALKEKHRPTLPPSFWAKYAPKRGCSVVSEPNTPISESSY